MLRIIPVLLFFLLIPAFCPPAHSFTCPELSLSDARQRMTSLANDIRYHNKLYYEKSQPQISDAEYDRLFASLVHLEECFPALVAANSPTRLVGSGAGTGTVKHEQPMLSLSSATGPEAVEALLERVASEGNVQFLVQPKVDGVPVELRYESGRLVSASTRGDGHSGEDVTQRVREVVGIPHKLLGTYPERVVVRGEIYGDLRLMRNYMTGPTAEKYATPRHLAAGVLLAQKPDPAAVALLRLFPFELVGAVSGGGSTRSDRTALALLATWGFPVDVKQTHTVLTFAEIRAAYRAALASRAQQPFAMDGIVVKVDDLSLRQRLGVGERAPFWAAAWKFPPDTALARVRRIHWTIGRTGRRTPIAEIEPVHLGGVRVTRVSLHNAAEFVRLDIGAGDLVVVALVGDVIPRVLEVVSRSGRTGQYNVPVPVQKPENACLSDSPVCRNQFLARLVYFVSKSGLDIPGLGRSSLKKLVEAGLITDIPSLFLLKATAVADVPGFGPERARRLTVAIRSARHAAPFRIITALGISGVGPKTVQRLARQFATVEELLAAGRESRTALAPADARAVNRIRSFFTSPAGEELLLKFHELGIMPTVRI